MAGAVPRVVGGAPRSLWRSPRRKTESCQEQIQGANQMNDKSRPNTGIERTYRASPKELWELWTTKDGFESWWGPEGFCAKVHTIEGRAGGKLFYDMVAATPEMAEVMKKMDRPASHETRGHFAEFRPY